MRGSPDLGSSLVVVDREGLLLLNADESGCELVLSPVLFPTDAGMAEIICQRVDRTKTDRSALIDEGRLLTGLVQRVFPGALEAEIADHLDYEPHDSLGRGWGNSREGRPGGPPSSTSPRTTSTVATWEPRSTLSPSITPVDSSARTEPT